MTETNRNAHCDGKHPYESRGLAQQVADRANRGASASEPYKCEYCGKWHVGYGMRNRRAKQKKVKRIFR